MTKAKQKLDTPRRPGALNTLARVREELSQVYRDGRTGRIKTNEMTRFAYTLRELGTLIERETWEQRITALEDARE